MKLDHLVLENFRLVQAASVRLAPGVNLFVGENAQGKTTILEAVAYLTSGRSFRTSNDRDCISHLRSAESEILPFAAAEGHFNSHDTHHRLRMALTNTGKTFWVDDKTLPKLGDLWGLLNSVTFVPSDLELVQGAPNARRALLGALLARTSRFDLQSMQRYTDALRQRAALLRMTTVADGELEIYEEQMAKYGARLLIARERIVRALGPMVGAYIQELTRGADTFLMAHETGFPKAAGITAADMQDTNSSDDTLRFKMLKFWAQNRAGDKDRKRTLHGPHLADLSLVLNGQDARGFASQGQARTVVLALRLAEVDLLEKLTGESPVLLLDDVLGELDTERTRLFIRILSRPGIQALLTATDTARIGLELPVSTIFEVRRGVIKRV